jgi:hypothetical protein
MNWGPTSKDMEDDNATIEQWCCLIEGYCTVDATSAFVLSSCDILALPFCVVDESDRLESQIYPYRILVKTHSSNKDHDQAKMEAFVKAVVGDDPTLGASYSD